MALQTIRVCDLCLALSPDSDPRAAAAEVVIGWQGKDRSLDLCEEHADAFTGMLNTGTQERNARKIVRSSKKAESPKETAPKPFSSAAVRQWAEAEGRDYPKRGSIPAELLLAYKKAQG